MRLLLSRRTAMSRALVLFIDLRARARSHACRAHFLSQYRRLEGSLSCGMYRSKEPHQTQNSRRSLAGIPVAPTPEPIATSNGTGARLIRHHSRLGAPEAHNPLQAMLRRSGCETTAPHDTFSSNTHQGRHIAGIRICVLQRAHIEIEERGAPGQPSLAEA